ncbi:YheC/YheD family protein [Sediminibacillus albus]|uniref:YheC/D like ATP-grasp n=1 Tax=Sediminibacillus albus TaxID=407036 RepID=A0A1G8XEZ3_9BACI|nr:YheC/YheD family protein [Sediminibacillus albus]SDJ89189.1 YheC/D like ATP-grasp [Sediminibacillus albus]
MNTFTIKFYQGNRNRIIVPYRHLSQFQMIEDIQYGPIHSPVEILVHDKDPSTLYVSSRLKAVLNLHKSSPITIKLEKNRCSILLTMGVFTAGFEESRQQPLGERTPIFEQLSIAGETLGFQALFFGHQHIDKEKRMLNGYYYRNNQWENGWFTFPNVIYDRIPNRKIEHHPDIVNTKSILQNQSVFFNHGFFNKWEIYQSLIKDQACSFLVPETILHPSKQKIETMLAKYNIYIKPIHGSRGNGITKCRLLSSGEIECHYYLQDKPQVNRYEKTEAFFQQHFPNGLQGYVAQQEISLIKKGKSPIDFRLHVNKNHRNSWEVTLICAKFAGKGSLTTHVKRGGKVLLLKELFTEDQAEKISKRLNAMALLVSTSVEKGFQSPIGEVGIDFGMDTEGRVWLFEVNSKPGFSVFNHPELYQQSPHVLSYPFRYGFYLNNLRNIPAARNK